MAVSFVPKMVTSWSFLDKNKAADSPPGPSPTTITLAMCRSFLSVAQRFRTEAYADLLACIVWHDCLVPTKTIPIDGPLDLRATIRPLHGSFTADGWWLAARTDQGPASIRLTRTPEGLKGDAWGDGADEMLTRLGRLGGLDDDPLAFSPADEMVSELHRRNPGLRISSTGQVFDHLLVAIVGQKVTGAEATRALRGLSQEFSETAPGPNERLRLPPDPARMAEAPYWTFHELGLEKKRADIVRTAAQRAVRIDAMAGDPPEVAERSLRAIPGIGPWTAAETLVRSHGYADALSVGDYHIKNLVSFHLTGRPRGTDEEMIELMEPFRPHRARVIRLLHTLGHAPKYGPRSVPRDFRAY
jgi:3-methyladenine DNA glycosylase/8-oxoguanine DNA glycosylase